MVSVASAARINLGGFRGDRSVTEDSPLEAQVELVYQAALHYAKANGFESFTVQGTAGYRGKIVMSQVVTSLFPRVSGDDLKNLRSLIYQALRRSNAAVCLHHGQDVAPTWWINSAMPANIRFIIGSIRSPKESMPLTHTERKLTETEAGEDLAPGEVTVRQKETETTVTTTRNPAEHLKGHQLELAERHQRLLKRILEEIATNPQPLSSNDLHAILSEETGMVSTTTFSTAVAKLVEAGELVFRKETTDEARVRGGGQMPLATRPRLYAIAPGPVPTRTAIPDGVTATPSAREIHDRAAAERQAAREAEQEQRERCETAVLAALARRGLSIGELCEELAIRSDAERAFLRGTADRLVEEGKADHRNGRWYLPDGARRVATTAELKDAVDEVQAEIREAEESRASDNTDDKLERLLRERVNVAVHNLAAHYATAAAEELEQENADLKARVAELEAKVAKQRAAIDALS